MAHTPRRRPGPAAARPAPPHRRSDRTDHPGSPIDGDRTMSEHTDRQQRTTTRVYSGEWLANSETTCRHRYREGFTGTPAGNWNGWEAFSVTPPVMAAIIDSHHADMTALIAASAAAGRQLDEAWLDAVHHMASLSWLGPLVVVDSRVLHADPTQLEVVAPDETGRYRVGFGWCWDAVDPADVHTIRSGPPALSAGRRSSHEGCAQRCSGGSAQSWQER